MKFCFFFLVGFVLCYAAKSHAKVSDYELRNFAIASFYPEKDEYISGEEYVVVWRGKPTPFPIHVQVGVDTPLNGNDYGGGTESDIAGIKVRVRAFDVKNKEVGQINKPGKADNTFFTGQPCTFTPPKPGSYRLILEILTSNGKAIPFLYSLSSKDDARAINLLVFSVPAPQMAISYSSWRETPGQTDLYERKISIEVTNSSAMTPIGYATHRWRTDIPQWVHVKLRVEPKLRLKNLSEQMLKQVSWLSPAKPRINLSFHSPNVATQYFRYDPLRDTPRELSFYEVKAQAVR